MTLHILLLGSSGQLGWELHRCLAPLGAITALDYPQLDLADADSIRSAFKQAQPDIVINAAAYTAVDQAESEPELAQAINAIAPGILAELTSRANAALIHYSTDYVFSGQPASGPPVSGSPGPGPLEARPYLETDPPGPLNTYGSTKLAGEQAVIQAGKAYLILRTSWVYSMRRSSFVSKVLEWAHTQTVMRVVSDQISSPTWARLLAETTAQTLAGGLALTERDPLPASHLTGWLQERRGLYHLAGDGYASRLEWAKAILQLDPHREQQTVGQILPSQTSQFPAPARRPLFSALNCDLFARTFGLRLPPWQQALQLAMRVE